MWRKIFTAVAWGLLLMHVKAAPSTTVPPPTEPRTTARIGQTANWPNDANRTSLDADMQALVKTYVAASVLKKCTLTPNTNEVIKEIREALDEGTKMIRYNLNLQDAERFQHTFDNSDMYKPFFWVRSTGRNGTGLLHLKPQYDILSLTTLNLGVKTMDVNLVEEPSRCLSSLSSADIEILIRELVMNDFQNTSSGHIVKLKESDSVCNMHVVDEDGDAEFKYFCCQREESLHITCKYLDPDTAFNVLNGIIWILKILVVLFSPRFIPGTFYRANKVATRYTHTIKDEKLLTLKVMVTRKVQQHKAKNVFRLSEFVRMKKFCKVLKNMQTDITYDINVKHLQMRIKPGRLLPEGSAPVGLFETLYEAMFKCEIRKRSAVKACCDSTFINLGTRRCAIPWHKALKNLMKFVLLLFLLTPWIIRVAIYFLYEHDKMLMRRKVASEKSLSLSFPGSLTLFLTPVHLIFLVIYLILLLESCIYGVLSRKLKEKFKFVLRKCFQDMRDVNKMDVTAWVIECLVKPCTKFGAVGICLGLLFWPLSVILFLPILAFYFCPTINVTLRLVGHLILNSFCCPQSSCFRVGLLGEFLAWVDQNQKELEKSIKENDEQSEKKAAMFDSYWKRFYQFWIIVICLVSMFSVIFLLTEVVAFVTDVIVLTSMGLIVNSDTTFTYLTLGVLLGVYGFGCFGYVKNKFLSFNQTMHEVILKLGEKQVDAEIYRKDNKHNNIAFRVSTDDKEEPEQYLAQSLATSYRSKQIHDEPVCLTSNNDGSPRWTISRLVLFLTDKERPMIPRGFYFDCCKMDYYSAPGDLIVNYAKAFVEFFMIILFLMFVVVVVMAFGDSYKISTTNKMLATIAGGILPFMLKEFVFKSHTVEKMNKEDKQFQACLHDLLKGYKQTWPIHDIEVVGNPTKDVTSTKPRSENGNGETARMNGRHNSYNHSVANGNNEYDNFGDLSKDEVDMLIHMPDHIDQDDLPNLWKQYPVSVADTVDGVEEEKITLSVRL